MVPNGKSNDPIVSFLQGGIEILTLFCRYVNQNQFFRQIRNFIFDLTQMPQATDDDGQALVPTGIHWQVAQATSLQNLVFNMPTTSDTTAVGIFTENGSGGFVSDLV